MPPLPMIELRNDTLTQREGSALLGKGAALFMANGTTTNQVRIRAHAGHAHEFSCDLDGRVTESPHGAIA